MLFCCFNEKTAYGMRISDWSSHVCSSDLSLSALARLYQSGGLNAKAAQTFRMLLAQKPADRDAMVGLIDTASASGDMDTARAVAQQAIQTHPADYRVYMAAARMAQTRRRARDPPRYLQTATAPRSEDPRGGKARGSQRQSWWCPHH